MNASAKARIEDDSKPLSSGGRVLEALLIVLVFFVIAGDPAPHNNEAHYLCRLKHFWNPAWCAGDLFLDSPDAHGLFVWLFGWVTKWLLLPATAWLGRLLAWTCLAWAWQRLSWRLIPTPLASVLTAALWVTLAELTHLAGEWAVGGVESKCFAYAFLLLALREIIDGRWNHAWVWLGVATAFHVLVGGWSVMLCAGIWLLEQRRNAVPLDKMLQATAAMLPGLIAGGLLSLLGVVPAIALTWNQPAELVAEANQIYVFERLPHHLSLLTLPYADIARRFSRHGLLLIAFWWLSRQARKTRTCDDGLSLIAWYAWGAVLLAAIGFAIEIIFWNNPPTAANLLRYYWFRLTDVAVPLAVSLQSVSLIAAGFAQRKAWAVWGLAAAIGLTSFHIGINTAGRWIYPVPPADEKMTDYGAWIDACDWIAANTPQKAIFLTPRMSSSFKWRTGRAEVATNKDIPQDAHGIVEWFERMQNIFYYETVAGDEPTNSPGKLGTRRVAEMARLYGASYIVSDQDHPLALKAVYPNREHPNDEYVVYALED